MILMIRQYHLNIPEEILPEYDVQKDDNVWDPDRSEPKKMK